MLTEDNLCKVVLKLGTEYLSEVCTRYPRMIMQYGAVMEAYLYVSCPAVISRLMEKSAIGFGMGEDELPAADYPYTSLYVFESAVRNEMIKILQEARYMPLSVRLFTAFTILEEGIRMYQDGQSDVDILRENVRVCTQEAILRKLELNLAQIIDERSRYQVLRKLLEITIAFKNYDRFAELIQQAVRYFDADEFERYLSDRKRFEEICLTEYKDFYINYWVYRIFSEVIAIPDHERSKERFIYIAIGQALFQTIALAAFVKNGRADREEYVYIISCLSRLMEHSGDLRKKLKEKIHECGLASAAGVLLLAFI